MPFQSTHGKLTVLTVDTKDISLSTKTSNFSGTGDVHDNSGYGLDNHTYQGGMKDGKFTASGSYDLTALTGTAAVLEGKEASTMALVRKIAGTGTGKPQESFSAVLTKFDVSDPCDDIVSWSAEWQVSGVVDRTPQV